mgnify:CR=1 FL=1
MIIDWFMYDWPQILGSLGTIHLRLHCNRKLLLWGNGISEHWIGFIVMVIFYITMGVKGLFNYQTSCIWLNKHYINIITAQIFVHSYSYVSCTGQRFELLKNINQLIFLLLLERFLWLISDFVINVGYVWVFRCSIQMEIDATTI